MRVCWLTGLVFFLLIAACDPDPAPKCEEAYNHLIALAKRAPQAEQHQRFITACLDAFDEGRHACLLEAKSITEALACRPTKVRPG